jgi:membrane protein implicated in regulation of membrane protease activity
MFDVNSLGKALIVFGIVLVLAGVILTAGARLPWFGRLPGDIFVQKKNFSFYFPITTSILISVILSILFFLLKRR